jgi:hypothetical protein
MSPVNCAEIVDAEMLENENVVESDCHCSCHRYVR